MPLFKRRSSLLEVQNQALIKAARERAARIDELEHELQIAASQIGQFQRELQAQERLQTAQERIGAVERGFADRSRAERQTRTRSPAGNQRGGAAHVGTRFLFQEGLSIRGREPLNNPGFTVVFHPQRTLPGDSGRVSVAPRTSGLPCGNHQPHRPILRSAFRCAVAESYDWHRRPLCTRRKRPRRRQPAEQRDELAPFHSITSSARASSIGGISRPSALAVLILITNSKWIGCSTGSSAGWAPFRILSTYKAALRKSSTYTAE